MMYAISASWAYAMSKAQKQTNNRLGLTFETKIECPIGHKDLELDRGEGKKQPLMP
jgi:hypothetical protein